MPIEDGYFKRGKDPRRGRGPNPIVTAWEKAHSEKLFSEKLPNGLTKIEEADECLRLTNPGAWLDRWAGKAVSKIELSGPDGDPIEQTVSLASLANLGDTDLEKLAGIVGPLAVDGADQGGATAEAAIEDKQVLPLDGAASPGVV